MSAILGVDVGGTFTHAVALDGQTLALLGKAKVSTTHRAPEGVAKGIIESLNTLLEEAGIDPARRDDGENGENDGENAIQHAKGGRKPRLAMGDILGLEEARQSAVPPAPTFAAVK